MMKHKQKTPVRNFAIRARIYPDDQQRQTFAKTFGCCRKYWNLALEAWQQTSSVITPAAYKNDYPYLAEIDSSALCNKQLDLAKAIKNHKSNPDHFNEPQFKAKFFAKKSYSTCRNKRDDNIHLCVDENRNVTGLRLPKVKDPVSIVMHRCPPKNAELKKVTITCEPDQTYYASLLYEIPCEEYAFTGNLDNAVGIDYSSHDFGVTSDEQVLKPPHAYHNAEKRLALQKRRLSHMQGPRDEQGCKQTPSANYLKQRRRIARAEAHVRRIRKDFIEKTSTEITDRYDVIVFEDIDLRQQAKAKRTDEQKSGKRRKGPRFGKSVHDNGFGMFRNRVEQKAEEKGKLVIYIDKWFPSTQTCSVCGYRNTDLRGITSLGTRQWTCPHCKAEHDRDVNAARNIREKGKQTLVELTHKTGGFPGIASLCSDGTDHRSKRKTCSQEQKAPTSNALTH